MNLTAGFGHLNGWLERAPDPNDPRWIMLVHSPFVHDREGGGGSKGGGLGLAQGVHPHPNCLVDDEHVDFQILP